MGHETNLNGFSFYCLDFDRCLPENKGHLIRGPVVLNLNYP